MHLAMIWKKKGWAANPLNRFVLGKLFEEGLIYNILIIVNILMVHIYFGLFSISCHSDKTVYRLVSFNKEQKCTNRLPLQLSGSNSVRFFFYFSRAILARRENGSIFGFCGMNKCHFSVYELSGEGHGNIS